MAQPRRHVRDRGLGKRRCSALRGAALMSGAAAFNDRVARLGSLRLHWAEWNSGGGRPVVFVHGLTSQCHTWDPIAAALSAHRRVICPDLRGHGDSDWAPDGYWRRLFAADLSELLTTLQTGPVHLVGHSLGSQIALVVAATYPDL